MGNLWQDVRFGLRMLLKSPGFTFVAVLTLGLGVGANAAIFSVVNAVLLRPLPFQHQERLVSVFQVYTSDPKEHQPVSYPNFVDYKTQAQTLADMTTYSLAGTSLQTSGDAEPEGLHGVVASADLFPLLGVKPLVGRAFTNEEDKQGADPVIVLSQGVWQRRFNSDQKIVGSQIMIGGRSTTVLGVMPEGFKFPVDAAQVDYWMPIAADPGVGAMINRRGASFLSVVARLKDGVTREQADAELNAIARRLEEQYPDENAGTRAGLISLYEDIVGDVRPALLVLLGAVGLVLLIACANVANLLLARASARGKEMAIRTALGASRGRVIRQLLTESVLLALVGGAVGLLLAVWSIDVLVKLVTTGVPRLAEVSLDGRVMLFALGVSLLTGVIFGLAPALQASRSDLNEVLKAGGRGSTEGARRNRQRSLLIVSEVALSLVLLVSAGLLIKSFVRLLGNDPGFDTEHTLTVEVPLSRVKYPKPEQQANYFQQTLQRISALPGVEAVGATNLLPLSGNDSVATLRIEGRPEPAPGDLPDGRRQMISPDYFRAVGTPLRQGRAFSEHDDARSTPVVIVNEAFARKYFAGEGAVGKRIQLDNEKEQHLPAREIVGVVGDIRHGGLGAKAYPGFYLPYLQTPVRTMTFVVRSVAADPSALTASVRQALREQDASQLVGEPRTMRSLVARSVAWRRFQMLLLGVFALVALVLASVGIFGVINYSVTQRTHEIGIRLALGAGRGDVLRLIVGQGLSVVLVGVVVGLAGAFAATRLLASLLYNVSATDPLIFSGVALLLALVAFFASYVPARRAARVDPMIALRYE